MTTAKVTPLYDFKPEPARVVNAGFGHLGRMSESLEAVAAEFEAFAATLRAHAAKGGRLGMMGEIKSDFVPVIFPAGVNPDGALSVGLCAAQHTAFQPTAFEGNVCPSDGLWADATPTQRGRAVLVRCVARRGPYAVR